MSCTRKLLLYQPLGINARYAKDIIDLPVPEHQRFSNCNLLQWSSKLNFNYGYMRLRAIIEDLRKYFDQDKKNRDSSVRDDLKRAFNMLMEFFKSKRTKTVIGSPTQINKVLDVGSERKNYTSGDSKLINQLPEVLEQLITSYRTGDTLLDKISLGLIDIFDKKQVIDIAKQFFQDYRKDQLPSLVGDLNGKSLIDVDRLIGLLYRYDGVSDDGKHYDRRSKEMNTIMSVMGFNYNHKNIE